MSAAALLALQMATRLSNSQRYAFWPYSSQAARMPHQGLREVERRQRQLARRKEGR